MSKVAKITDQIISYEGVFYAKLSHDEIVKLLQGRTVSAVKVNIPKKIRVRSRGEKHSKRIPLSERLEVMQSAIDNYVHEYNRYPSHSDISSATGYPKGTISYLVSYRKKIGLL